MTARSTAPHCGNCAQAQALIDRLAGTRDQPMPLPDLVANTSALLYIAMSLLFSEFDYEAKKYSNTGMALRILATATERMSHMSEGCARMRESWMRGLRHTPLARVRLRAKPAAPSGRTGKTGSGTGRSRRRKSTA